MAIEHEFRNIMPAFLEENLYCSALAIERSPFGFAFSEELELLLSWKNALSCTRRRNFSRSCLTESKILLAIGTKLRPLLRTDFPGSDNGKFIGIVTTASWLSFGGSRWGA